MLEALIVLLLLAPVVILIVLLVKVVTLSGQVSTHARRLRELETYISQTLQQESPAAYAERAAQPTSSTTAVTTPAATAPVIPPAAVPDAAPAHAASAMTQDATTAVAPAVEQHAAEPPAVTMPLQAAQPAAHAAPAAASAPVAAPPGAPPGMRPAPGPQRAPKPPTRTNAEWEQLIGGKLLNRIGAVALILGVGFFLKYAFDKEWIPEAVRVLFGGAIGVALVAGGWRFEKKGLQIFAQGLLGAGIAILYTSVFASFNFYHLVPQGVAFALMSVVTAFTFLLALRYDSLAISLLGWAGGFLTPFMLSTGVSNEVGLFTYVALLDLGLLAVILKKDSWVVLEPLTMAGTYLLFYAWRDQYYAEPMFVVTVGFLVLFWLLFFLLDLAHVARPATKYTVFHQLLGALNLLFFYPALMNLLDTPFHDNAIAAVSASLAAVYFLSWVLIRTRQPEQRVAHGRLTVSAILLATLAIPQHFDGFAIIPVMALFAALLLWAGKQRNEWHIVISAVALLAIAFLGLLGTDGSFAYADVKIYRPFLNMRLAGYLSLAVAMLFGGTLFSNATEQAGKALHAVLGALGAFVVFLLCTVETTDLFRTWMDGGSGDMRDLLLFDMFMVLSAVWAMYAVALSYIGLRLRAFHFLYLGFGALFLALAMGGIRGIAFEPIAWFTPVLNIRFVVLVLLMIALFIHWNLARAREAAMPWLRQFRSVVSIAVVVMLLMLLTGETRDFFEKTLVSLYLEEQSPEIAARILSTVNLQQLALSSMWLIFSIVLMVYGLLRRVRLQRIAAFVLFGISILKIFIYDLSSLETLYRIFSFIGLGVILLAVSYLFTRYKEVIFGGEEEKG
ncbi:MAG: DUF2339 domain-containing protein [Ignavibacteria bacterium]|nr:DUF2339 domain-containing protein [Ignavibacteria bacterium]